MKYPEGLLVQFAKTPRLGHVKTRLQPALSAQGCLELHKALVRHTYQSLEQSLLAPIEIWITDNSTQHFFTELAGSNIRLQRGRDLGQKMLHAFSCCLERAQPVIMVGSDCPFIDQYYLDTAFSALSEGHDIVLGPAQDGGYVLIGLKRLTPELFQNIPWGTSEVLSKTLGVLAGLGWRYHLLEPLSDIDRPEDLHLLPESLHGFLRGQFLPY